MQNKFDSKPGFSGLEADQGPMPLKIFSISTVKTEQRKEAKDKMDCNSGCSDVFSNVEMPQERNENLSHSWTEGSWAYRREEIDEETPSLEVRHEALKRIFQSLDQSDGRTSSVGTSMTPDENKATIGQSDKGESDEFYIKLQEAVEKRVSENYSRLSNPTTVSGDIFSMSGNVKPKTAPSRETSGDRKHYYFPELRSLIEGRIEETKVETLTNRLERELMRREHLCNEQALMLQMLMTRVHDLEKRQPKRGTTAPANWSRQARMNSGMCCCTSSYVVEKATQTPSDVHDAEGVYVMVARNSGARAKKVQRRIAYGYPERITEEKKVSTFLNRKVVTQHIEFLPPIPEPFAKKRPRDAKRPGWHTV